MSRLVDFVEGLISEVGARPAASVGEYEAAKYIAQHFDDCGLDVAMQEFTCARHTGWVRAAYYLLGAVAAILFIFAPNLVFLSFILMLLSVLLLVLDLFDKNPLFKLFSRGLSQNVISRYIPRGAYDRRRKVVIIAHYDSGRSVAQAAPALARHYLLIRRVIRIAAIALFVVVTLGLLPVPDIMQRMLNVFVFVLGLVILAAFFLEVANFFLPFSQGANSNGSGIAVLIGLAKRLARERSVVRKDTDAGRRKTKSSPMPKGSPVSKSSPVSSAGFDGNVKAGTPLSPRPTAAGAIYAREEPAVASLRVEAKQSDSLFVGRADSFGQPVAAGQQVGQSAVNQQIAAGQQAWQSGQPAVNQQIAAGQQAGQLVGQPAEPVRQEIYPATDLDEHTQEFDSVGKTNYDDKIAFAPEGPSADFSEKMPPGVGEEIAPGVRRRPPLATQEEQNRQAQLMAEEEKRRAIEEARQRLGASGVPTWFEKAKQRAAEKETPQEKSFGESLAQRSRFADVPPGTNSASPAPEITERERPREFMPIVPPASTAFRTPRETVVEEIPDELEAILSRIIRKDVSFENRDFPETPVATPMITPMIPPLTAPVTTPVIPPVTTTAVKTTAVTTTAVTTTTVTTTAAAGAGAAGVGAASVGAVGTAPVGAGMAAGTGAAGATVGTSAPAKGTFGLVANIDLSGLDKSAFDVTEQDRRASAAAIPSQASRYTTPQSSPQIPQQARPQASPQQVSQQPRPQLSQQQLPQQQLPQQATPQEKPKESSSGSILPEMLAPVRANVSEERRRAIAVPSVLPGESGAIIAQQKALDNRHVFYDEYSQAEDSLISLTGSFAALGATGAMKPVSEEMFVHYGTGENIYVEDVDDSNATQDHDNRNSYAPEPQRIAIPQSRKRSFLGGIGSRFSGKRNRDDNRDDNRDANRNGNRDRFENSASEWIGANDNFNARHVGRDSGSWDRFSEEDSDSWRGGAYGGDSYGKNVKALESFSAELLDKEVWLVALGAHEAKNAGIKRLLNDFPNELRNAIILNIDSIGTGDLCFTVAEGTFRKRYTEHRLQSLIQSSAEAIGVGISPALFTTYTTDAYEALNIGARAISIIGLDRDLPVGWRWTDDNLDIIIEAAIQETVDLVFEVIKSS